MRSESEVERLNAELFGEGAVSLDHEAGSEEYGLIGGGEGIPLALIPVANRSAAAGSLLRWTDATTRVDVLKRMLGAAPLRVGLGRAIIRRRVFVRSEGDGTLLDHLAKLLGEDHVHISATFGPPRPNQKPVVRVFNGRGETVAFVKVGWNTLTRELVDTEVEFLETRTRGLRLVSTPPVLHHGSWRGRTLGVLGSLVGTPPLRSTPRPTKAMIEEVAGLSDRYHAPIDRSPFWQGLGHEARGTMKPPLEVVAERWASTTIPFGHWHGDWAPWNMRHDGTNLIVWDWERNAAHVPVGFDVLHYEYQTRAVTDGHTAAAFLAGLEASKGMLQGLGVPAESHAGVAILYLVELQRRFGPITEGEPPAARAHRAATAQVLKEVVARLA